MELACVSKPKVKCIQYSEGRKLLSFALTALRAKQFSVIAILNKLLAKIDLFCRHYGMRLYLPWKKFQRKWKLSGGCSKDILTIMPFSDFSTSSSGPLR